MFISSDFVDPDAEAVGWISSSHPSGSAMIGCGTGAGLSIAEGLKKGQLGDRFQCSFLQRRSDVSNATTPGKETHFGLSP